MKLKERRINIFNNLGGEMKTTSQLRALMKKGTVLVPGSWDAMSARMVEKMGFDAVYMTGWGASLSTLGRADLTYITQTEMLQVAHHITTVVNIPLIADIDDGFGHILNVQRTIELSQKYGIAGVQIEDMAAPKRCVNVGGGRLIPAEDMVKKIKAALAVRFDPDFVIIARTDNHEGIDELEKRAKMYAEAGADLIYPLGLTTKAELERISKAVSIPLMIEQIGAGKTPLMTRAEAEELNVMIFAYTLESVVTAYWASKNLLERLKPLQGDKTKSLELSPTFKQLVELEHFVDIEKEEENQLKFFPRY
jgi:2-methylisocitrate lyase-like PEP mutase family enzyme